MPDTKPAVLKQEEFIARVEMFRRDVTAHFGNQANYSGPVALSLIAHDQAHRAALKAAEEENGRLRDAISVETREVERRIPLDDRYRAVRAFVHAIDYLGRQGLRTVQATSLLMDGVINAIDGRTTGREHRTIRHSFYPERDGSNPPGPVDSDRRCYECGAVAPDPFTHCWDHRPAALQPLHAAPETSKARRRNENPNKRPTDC